MPKLRPVAVTSHLVALALLAFAVAQAQEPARLQGVWSASWTTFDSPSWRVEDHLCGTCVLSEYRHLQRLLADEANRDRSLSELQQETRATGRELADRLLVGAARERLANVEQPADTSLTCEPPSLMTVWGNPLPLALRFEGGNVILHAQHWNVVRTIRVSGAAPLPGGEPSLYGDATARFEGETLVVESVNVLPMVVGGEAVTTGKAKITERYTPSEDGSRLDSEFEIDDPGTYREPRSWYRPRIRTPEVQIVEDDPCANLQEWR